MSLDRDELHVVREEKQAMLDEWSKKVAEYEDRLRVADERIKVLTGTMDKSLSLRAEVKELRIEAKDLRDMVTMQRDVIAELHGRIAALDGELKRWREGPVDEAMLRKHDGCIHLGQGVPVVNDDWLMKMENVYAAAKDWARGIDGAADRLRYELGAAHAEAE